MRETRLIYKERKKERNTEIKKRERKKERETCIVSKKQRNKGTKKQGERERTKRRT